MAKQHVVKAAAASVESCPCGSGLSYAQCCAPLHQGRIAATPEALMRSRYSAYVKRLTLYLLATWHRSTRPHQAALDLGDGSTKWLGLRIVEVKQDDPEHASVEFIARYRVGGGKAVRLHEVSQFVHERGMWFYVDGTFKS